MKKNVSILLTVWTVCAMTSCDPTKLIILKNKTNKPAHFSWTIRTDTTDVNNEQFKTVTFDLGTSKGDREKTIVFGFGTWPTSEIERFVDNNIKAIQIEGEKTKVHLTDKEEIKKYLVERRRGLLKNFIKIKVY